MLRGSRAILPLWGRSFASACESRFVVLRTHSARPMTADASAFAVHALKVVTLRSVTEALHELLRSHFDVCGFCDHVQCYAAPEQFFLCGVDRRRSTPVQRPMMRRSKRKRNALA